MLETSRTSETSCERICVFRSTICDHTFLPTFANMPEAQHTHVAHHGVQRCSQLVGEHREELVLHAIGFFGLPRDGALERDVPRDLGGANDRPVGIFNRGDRQRDLEEAAVLPLTDRLEMIDASPGPDAREHLVFL